LSKAEEESNWFGNKFEGTTIPHPHFVTSHIQREKATFSSPATVSEMSLVSGPGRAGGSASTSLPDELQLAIEAHVKYIQSLDSVRPALPAASS